MKTSLVLVSSILALGALAGCSGGKETVLIYATAEEERIDWIQNNLNKHFPEYNIVIQYYGTGALVSKLQGEGVKTNCDIIFELEANNMEFLRRQNANFFSDLSEYDFSQFTDAATEYGHKFYAPGCMTFGGVVFNTAVLAAHNAPIPATYEDLLNPIYKDLIMMPNPRSSGTGYLFYNGVASYFAEKTGSEAVGKQKALEYFSALDKNIKEYTSSGSAPIKAANRGEIGIGLAILWQCVEYKAGNENLQYSFLDYGAPSNLYAQAIIKGHETKESVKRVWDYIFYDMNKTHVEIFVPDPIYKNTVPENPDYPTNIDAIHMHGLFDPDYKTAMLDAWVW